MSSRYSHDERYKIIRYILDNEILSRPRGYALWKDMEKAKIINRSWHSIRTQFNTTIINMLHRFDLTDDERKQILNRYRTKESKSDSETSTFPEEGPETHPETSIFSEERSKSDSETSTSSKELSKSVAETLTSREEAFKSDSESSSSLDLLFPVKTSCNSTCTTNTNECSSEEIKSQKHQADKSNKQITRFKKVTTDKVTADKATQVTAPAYANRQCNLYRAGKYIGWSDNGVKHIFIPNIDKDHNEKRREIHNQFIIPDENIHVVSLQAYTTMNDVINCDTEFKLLCNEFVKTGKFNSTHVAPILDKMNQVNMNFTDNDLVETVSNVQSEKET